MMKLIDWLWKASLRKYYMKKIGATEAMWIRIIEDPSGWSLHNNLIVTRDHSGVHGYLNTGLDILYSKQGLVCYRFGPDYGDLRKNAVNRLQENLADKGKILYD